MGFEAVGGKPEKLRRGREVPVGIPWLHVTQVDRQVREPGVNVGAFAAPSKQAPHGEGMTKAMQARALLSGRSPQAGPAGKREKSVRERAGLQPTAALGGEECPAPAIVPETSSLRSIDA